MNSFGRWIFIIAFFTITVLLVNKGIELWSIRTAIDGDGIGINLLGLEISDRVPKKDIASYSFGFFITGVITLSASIFTLKVKSKTAAT